MNVSAWESMPVWDLSRARWQTCSNIKCRKKEGHPNSTIALFLRLTCGMAMKGVSACTDPWYLILTYLHSLHVQLRIWVP